MTKLTDKQELFCNEYLVDLNGTQAAIRAGYSEATAKEIAYENLTKPHIQERLTVLMEERAARLELSQDMVLREYCKLAFFDIRKIFNEDGSLKKVVELDDETAGALVSMKTLASMETEYKLADKKGALDSLARHLGMFVDKVEMTGKDGGPIEVVESPRESIARKLSRLAQRSKNKPDT